jgi:hypothetical protein
MTCRAWYSHYNESPTFDLKCRAFHYLFQIEIADDVGEHIRLTFVLYPKSKRSNFPFFLSQSGMTRESNL